MVALPGRLMRVRGQPDMHLGSGERRYPQAVHRRRGQVGEHGLVAQPACEREASTEVSVEIGLPSLVRAGGQEIGAATDPSQATGPKLGADLGRRVIPGQDDIGQGRGNRDRHEPENEPRTTPSARPHGLPVDHRPSDEKPVDRSR